MKKHGNLVAQFDELMDSCEQAEDVTSFYIRGLRKKILTRILSRSPCAKVAKGVCTAKEMQKYKKLMFGVISRYFVKYPVIMGGSNNGPVTSDLTYVGAKPKNKNANHRFGTAGWKQR
eukprot:1104795_1